MAYTKVGGVPPIVAAPPNSILSGSGPLPGVIPPSGSNLNPDAQAFLTASGTSGDATISAAINNLVIGLQAGALWGKMIAMYPFVGGTSTSCKWNLKDPQDTDAAKRLVFTGAWTFSSNGATAPTGGTGRANPFIANTELGSTSGHISCFLRTVRLTGFYCQMGYKFPGDDSKSIFICTNPGTPFTVMTYLNGGASGTGYSNGYYILNRRTSTATNLYFNGTNIIGSGSTPGTQDGGPMYIGNTGNDSFGACGDQFTFASLGSGLTIAEVAELNTLIQTFQTELGR